MQIKRRQYFIRKDFQGKYIFRFFVTIALGGGVCALLFSLFSADTLSIVYQNYILKIERTPLALLKQILVASWVVIVVGGVTGAILSLYLSHRVAGPIYRFEKILADMITGQVGLQTRLRKKDECKEIADQFNQLNRIWAARLLAAQQALDELDRCLQTQDPQPPGADEIQSAMTRLKDAMNFFQLHA